MTNEPTKNDNQDCAQFQERMPDLFGSETDFSKEEHLENCENCAELVRDLNYIAQQAKLLMPIHDPAPAVWDHIRDALQASEGESR
jgi:predicted anti-sigma-YlaC factor YlaD